jgi:hypothetical protein
MRDTGIVEGDSLSSLSLPLSLPPSLRPPPPPLPLSLSLSGLQRVLQSQRVPMACTLNQTCGVRQGILPRIAKVSFRVSPRFSAPYRQGILPSPRHSAAYRQGILPHIAKVFCCVSPRCSAAYRQGILPRIAKVFCCVSPPRYSAAYRQGILLRIAKVFCRVSPRYCEPALVPRTARYREAWSSPRELRLEWGAASRALGLRAADPRQAAP